MTRIAGSAGRPRQVTDDQIFDALAQAISQHGPTGFSMNKIAGLLNMTGPALGYRFGSKQGLLLAFAARQPSATDEYLTSTTNVYASPQTAIIEGLVGLVSGMTTRIEVANNLALLHLDLTNEQLRHHAAAQAKLIRRHLQELLAKAGLRDADLEHVADELYVLWIGTITSWAIDSADSADSLESALRKRLTRALSRELEIQTPTKAARRSQGPCRDSRC